MENTTRVAKGSFLLALIGLVLGCVVTPAEGYYDPAIITATITSMSGMNAGCTTTRIAADD